MNGASKPTNNKVYDPLLANLNAFKNKVKSAPIIPLQRPGTISNGGSPSKRQKIKKESSLEVKKEDGDEDEIKIIKEGTNTPIEVISDDDDDDDSDVFGDDSPSKKVRPGSIAAAALQASQSSMSKSHDSSKLLWATEYIQKKGKPVPMNELMDYLSLGPNDKVIDLLKKLEKIQYDSKKNSFKYISTYDVHSASELLKLLKSQVTFKGISCKELKDGWPQCDETINQLEEDSKILVLRTKKDRTPRYVWYNNGGDLHRIDEEFIKMWENVQLPQFSELPRKLQDLGLKPASVDPASIKRQSSKVEVKKKKQRKGKITNTHMAGILKDYSNRV
ncbi:transcription initiation factor IIE subunit beta [Monosporozyma unispora]|nr:transcription factor TFIIE subunit [Kazachstania unispora]